MQKTCLTILTILVLCTTSGLTLPVHGADLETMQQKIVARFGYDALKNFAEWRELLVMSRPQTEKEKLHSVNTFFNRHILFVTDMVAWGQEDYWATPLETLAKGQGDCEDFAIAKYFTLQQLGIPGEKLRLLYVSAKRNRKLANFDEAHLVLAYYTNANPEPLILDNLRNEILPASQRRDLTPIFSFNDQGIWHGTGDDASRSRLARWHDVQRRAQREGFHPGQ